MADLHLADGEKFDGAVLIDGSFMEKVWTCRSSGWDVRIFVTDGDDYAPIDSVVRLVGRVLS